MKYEYNRNLFVQPFYEGNTVYFETALFINEESVCSLTFPITKIIRVLNYGLQIEYEEGKDFLIIDGKIKRLKGSKIPFIKNEDYYLDQPNDNNVILKITNSDITRKFPNAKYFRYGEADTFTKYQIAVIYEHEQEWKGCKPLYQGNKLGNFLNNLKNKEKTTLLFYGDSITFGYNSSGTEMGGNIAPYAESYPKMVHGFLEDYFKTRIEYVNTSLSGMNTPWALENVEQNVNKYNPDLVVLAFGMNDGGMDPKDYEKWLHKIISKMISYNEKVNIIVVSPTVPNIDCNWFGNQDKFINVIRNINYVNVAYVDMTTMHLDLLKTGKKFADMTGNNINHPNDFLARIYAQSILKTIIK